MKNRIHILRLACLLFALACKASATPPDGQNWIRMIGPQSNVPGLKLLPFFVLSVGEANNHLEGACVYFNEGKVPGSKRVPLQVQSDGEELWAIVTLEAANEVKGPWQKVGSSAGTGPVFKVKVDPATSSPRLRVDLEAFRPFIEKYKFGRISLESGEGAIFELADLHPPKEEG